MADSESKKAAPPTDEKKQEEEKEDNFMEEMEPVTERMCKYQDCYWIIPCLFKYKEVVEKMETRPDDVFVCSFPKSGTTWTQEITWLILNNCDYDGAKTIPVDDRSIWLEDGIKEMLDLPYISPDSLPEDKPRLLKCHLPWKFLPASVHRNRNKIIWITRNPKDAAVSCYKMIRDFREDSPSVQEGLEGYQKNFLEGKVFSGPFADYSLSFWEHKDDDNVLLVYYEDMKKDHEGHVRRIGRFLGRELTDEQVEGIVAHTTFDFMKKNDAVSYKRYTENADFTFINKGQVGNWVSKFTPEMSERYDREIADKCAAKGLVWKY